MVTWASSPATSIWARALSKAPASAAKAKPAKLKRRKEITVTIVNNPLKLNFLVMDITLSITVSFGPKGS